MEKLPLGRQVRGRPPAEKRRQVVQDLIQATEHALAEKTANEITIREIAMAAGTSESMIRYYFGNKDGLFIAIIDDIMTLFPNKRHNEIMELCLSLRSISPLVNELCKFNSYHPNLIKMITAELLGSRSKVKDMYMKRYGNSIYVLVQDIVESMKSANIYRQDINSTFVTTSLIRLAGAPLVASAVFAGTPRMPPQIGGADWAAFIAHTIDSISM